MKKYTAEQVESAAEILEQDQNAPSWKRLSEMLNDYAALLRERESAKAGVTDEMTEAACRAYAIASDNPWPYSKEGWNDDDRAYMRAALKVVAPMMASALVPVEKENLDPVKLRRQGRVATEWEQGFNDGWNECCDAMFDAAPKPEKE